MKTILLTIVRWFVLCILLAVQTGCSPSGLSKNSPQPTFAPVSQILPGVSLPSISRYPPAFTESVNLSLDLEPFDPQRPLYYSVNTDDLSRLDLRDRENDLLHVSFDQRTVWPSSSKLPKGFKPDKILELGKDPGLGVRELHKQGITGLGVNIAIIDQPLIIDHEEYAGNLLYYDEVQISKDQNIEAEMHGPAVMSIAVGKTVGVAPDAHVFYIATHVFNPGHEEIDMAYYAQAIRRLIAINQQLPEDQKIRVLSMSVGWNPDDANVGEMNAAVAEAKQAGMFVVSGMLPLTYIGYSMGGAGRDPQADPNLSASYGPGLEWEQAFFNSPKGLASYKYQLLVPMDSRTFASNFGKNDYSFYRAGGLSWSVPYLAGVYALAVQVDPTITPERFWTIAMETGTQIEVQHNGETYLPGKLINPVALIKALQ